jgi:hypothetical protein
MPRTLDFVAAAAVPLTEARLHNLRIGFALMLTPQLRGLCAAPLTLNVGHIASPPNLPWRAK